MPAHHRAFALTRALVAPRGLVRSRSLAVVAMVGFLAVAVAGAAAAGHEVTGSRAGGENRYATAAAVAAETHPESTHRVVLARGDAFPDGLAGAPLARQLEAPLLLTRQDSLPAATQQALRDLRPTEVVLLGGPNAISHRVEEQLEDHRVERVAGSNRYETAARIARTIDSVAGGIGRTHPGAPRMAFLVDGGTFADALTAGAPAASQDNPFPILLTRQDTLPSTTRAALEDLDIEQVFIVGGPAAVSDHVRDHVRETAPLVTRLAGDDRFETALAVGDFARGILGFDGTDAVVARGDEFADALAAGPLAGRRRAPVLLTPGPDDLGDPAHTWLNDMCPVVDSVQAVGGPAAVSENVLANAVDAAERCHGEDGGTNQTYRVDPQEVRTDTPGTEFRFTVSSRYGDRAFTEGQDVALFPCDAVTATEPVVRFDDADDDGFADAIATTETNSAAIRQADEEDGTRYAEFGEDVGHEHGDLVFWVTSDAEDCAVAVVFKDVDDDHRLPVDGQGHPLEHFGVGQVVWQR